MDNCKITMPNGVEYILRQNANCWEFTGKADTDGYPRVKVFKKCYRLNRLVLAYKLKRDIKPGYLACHTCDNRICLNPDHLWEGTSRDNAVDAVMKGRLIAPGQFIDQRGEKNKSAKLTEEQVIEIRNLHEHGCLTSDLAAKFNVSSKSIQGIVSRRYWKHV